MEAIKRLQKLLETIRSVKLIEIDKHLEEKWEEMDKEGITFFLYGNYNSGKTTLLNALLKKKIYPTGNLPTTKEMVEVKLTNTIKIIDTPGVEDPEKDKENFERLKAKANKSHCIFVIRAGSGDADNEQLYKRLKELSPVTTLVVLNKDDDYSTNDIRKFFYNIRSKITALCPNINVSDINMFDINLLSAEKGGDEKKLILWANSGIEPFIRAFYNEYNRITNENNLEILSTIAKRLYPNHMISHESLSFYAESRILMQIFKGANVLSLSPTTRLIGEDLKFLEEELKKIKYYAEIRPATDDLYYQVDKRIRPIIEDVEFYFNEDYGPVAMVGLELRRCKITRTGGDLFILRCRLEDCELTVNDRSDLWVSESSFEKHTPAISISDRSKATVVAPNFDSRIIPLDADETSAQKFYNCEFEGSQIQHTSEQKASTQGFELRPYCFIEFSLSEQDDFIAFEKHFIVIQHNYWYLYSIPKGKLLDVGYWNYSRFERLGNNILIGVGTDLSLITIEGERFVKTIIPFKRRINDISIINNWLFGVISDEGTLYVIDRNGKIRKEFTKEKFQHANGNLFIADHTVFEYNESTDNLTKICSVEGEVKWMRKYGPYIVFKSSKGWFYCHTGVGKTMLLPYDIKYPNYGFHDDGVFGFKEGDSWTILFLDKNNKESVHLALPLLYHYITTYGWKLFCLNSNRNIIGIYEIYTPETIKKG